MRFLLLVPILGTLACSVATISGDGGTAPKKDGGRTSPPDSGGGPGEEPDGGPGGEPDGGGGDAGEDGGTCTPNCAGKACGASDGCGGTCPIAPSCPVTIDDFEDGDVTDWWVFKDAASTFSSKASAAQARGSHALELTYNVVAGGGYAGVEKVFATRLNAQAWTGISLWAHAANTGHPLRIELYDEGDERWEHIVNANWSGWKELSIPWASFVKAAWQPPGAVQNGQKDFGGLRGMAISPSFQAGTAGTVYIDDIALSPSSACTPKCAGTLCGSSDGCGGTCQAGSGCGDPGGEPPLTTTQYTASTAIILNPERGLYHAVNLPAGGDYSSVRANGYTLAYAGVNIGAYRSGPLPQSFLDGLNNGFASARAAGIKIILRFVYNECFCDDAPKSVVLQHISQLAPVIQANADVIAVWQGGFIGAWGEWHASTNNLLTTQNKGDIIRAMLSALPTSRMVQIRTPMHKSDVFGARLADGEAFTGTDRARTGHHNDCFLASYNDYGTYADPIDTWKDYVAQDGRFTPIGGETCGVNSPRSDCPSATAEMARLHWSFLNVLYHQGVLGSWTNQGCMDDVKRNLGYRLVLTEASYSSAVRPGGVLALQVKIRNDGYAAMYNARPVYAVLDDGTTVRAARLAAVDPRRWESGAVNTFSTKLRIPAGLAPGQYKLALWLPDDASTIRNRPEYAVQLANTGVWDAAKGYNLLTSQLNVDAQAVGSVDPSATEFVEIP